MKNKYALFATALLALGLARPASAATTFYLYAGPSVEYPTVTRVGNAKNVDIYGCLNGWDWCDVSYNGARGWMSASNLWQVHNKRRVNIVEYGPRTNVPVVVFEQRPYWDRWYRTRSFYGDKVYWRNVRESHHDWDNGHGRHRDRSHRDRHGLNN